MTDGVPQRDRIATLDVVRGVAVLGILVMNIVGFGLPDSAYFNPCAYGGDTGANLAVYLFNFVLFDGKMRGLFSFLFGASTLLVIERAEAAGASAARVHYARMAWLLLFGVIHLYGIWWGDILHHYALIGLLLFFFRRLSPRWLITVAIVLLSLQTALSAQLPAGIARIETKAAQPHPSARTLQALADFNDGFGKPSDKTIAAQLRLYRSDYPTIVKGRIADHASDPIIDLLYVGGETLAYMLLGMAMLKNGMLRGAWPVERYRRWLLIGFGIGIPAYCVLAAYLVSAKFSTFATVLSVITLSTPFRPLMIIGWACLIVILSRSGGALVTRLAATGQMAFTNYLATSLICSTIFYGYGFGWYGYLDRAQLYIVVAGMWALMLLWSKPWLARFNYGPMEWLWRSLARWRLQPLRRRLPLAEAR